MGIEIEPKTPAEKTLTIKLKDGRELSFPDQKWYPVTKTIADALDKQRRDTSMRLNQIITNNPSIKYMTVKELEMSGRLRELESKERSQTIICDQENFIKIILDYPFVKKVRPPRKDSPKTTEESITQKGKSKRPSGFNDFSLLKDEKRPPQTIRMPYQILAVNSVKDILSHLSDDILPQVPHDLSKYLEEVVQKSFESTFDSKVLLKHILEWDNSPIRLNRFFRVCLDAMLYDLWDVIDANERRLKEEKEIIETCKKLKRKGYDKKRAIQEVFAHFRIPVPEKYIL